MGTTTSCATPSGVGTGWTLASLPPGSVAVTNALGTYTQVSVTPGLAQSLSFLESGVFSLTKPQAVVISVSTPQGPSGQAALNFSTSPVTIGGQGGTAMGDIVTPVTYSDGTRGGSITIQQPFPGRWSIRVDAATLPANGFVINQRLGTFGVQNSSGTLAMVFSPTTNSVTWQSGAEPTLFMLSSQGILVDAATSRNALIISQSVVSAVAVASVPPGSRWAVIPDGFAPQTAVTLVYCDANTSDPLCVVMSGTSGSAVGTQTCGWLSPNACPGYAVGQPGFPAYSGKLSTASLALVNIGASDPDDSAAFVLVNGAGPMFTLQTQTSGVIAFGGYTPVSSASFTLNVSCTGPPGTCPPISQNVGISAPPAGPAIVPILYAASSGYGYKQWGTLTIEAAPTTGNDARMVGVVTPFVPATLGLDSTVFGTPPPPPALSSSNIGGLFAGSSFPLVTGVGFTISGASNQQLTWTSGSVIQWSPPPTSPDSFTFSFQSCGPVPNWQILCGLDLTKGLRPVEAAQTTGALSLSSAVTVCGGGVCPWGALQVWGGAQQPFSPGVVVVTNTAPIGGGGVSLLCGNSPVVQLLPSVASLTIAPGFVTFTAASPPPPCTFDLLGKLPCAAAKCAQTAACYDVTVFGCPGGRASCTVGETDAGRAQCWPIPTAAPCTALDAVSSFLQSTCAHVWKAEDVGGCRAVAGTPVSQCTGWNSGTFGPACSMACQQVSGLAKSPAFANLTGAADWTATPCDKMLNTVCSLNPDLPDCSCVNVRHSTFPVPSKGNQTYPQFVCSMGNAGVADYSTDLHPECWWPTCAPQGGAVLPSGLAKDRGTSSACGAYNQCVTLFANIDVEKTEGAKDVAKAITDCGNLSSSATAAIKAACADSAPGPANPYILPIPPVPPAVVPGSWTPPKGPARGLNITNQFQPSDGGGAPSSAASGGSSSSSSRATGLVQAWSWRQTVIVCVCGAVVLAFIIWLAVVTTKLKGKAARSGT